MVVIVVGSGKLANEIFEALAAMGDDKVIAWANRNLDGETAVVVHAGSGRDLKDVICYCEKTDSVLIELATGSEITNQEVSFPVILCPNTNVLMLKFMALLDDGGHYFKNHSIEMTESHQAEKTSIPGTAVSLAQSLGLERDEIRSVRDPAEQIGRLQIPQACLARHAYHRIVIEDSSTRLSFETKVFGRAPYADGLAKIISAVRANQLESRRYNIIEFVKNGWI